MNASSPLLRVLYKIWWWQKYWAHRCHFRTPPLYLPRGGGVVSISLGGRLCITPRSVNLGRDLTLPEPPAKKTLKGLDFPPNTCFRILGVWFVGTYSQSPVPISLFSFAWLGPASLPDKGRPLLKDSSFFMALRKARGRPWRLRSRNSQKLSATLGFGCVPYHQTTS